MTTETKIGPAAIAAANWWAQAVQAPVFDNGDKSEIGAVTSMLGTLLASRHEIDDEQSKSFAHTLARKIQKELDSRDFTVSLGVDYGPDLTLAEAAQEAGVSNTLFPWKTNMWIKPELVTVSAGYAARVKIVWASDEWLANRPTCDEQKFDNSRSNDSTYFGDPFVCSLPLYHEEAHQYDKPIKLCEVCGRGGEWYKWYHDPVESGHMPDFHEFQ